jgi:uncharacterized protein YecT (DUF1311 family)
VKSSNIAMTMCTHEALKTYDQKLNKVYRALFNNLEKRYSNEKSKPSTALLNSEKFWIKYRDQQCKMIYLLFSGGNGASLKEMNCLVNLTKKRVEDLEKFPLWN